MIPLSIFQSLFPSIWHPPAAWGVPLICHRVSQGLPGRAGLPGADGVPGPPGTMLMLPVSPPAFCVGVSAALWSQNHPGTDDSPDEALHADGRIRFTFREGLGEQTDTP